MRKKSVCIILIFTLVFCNIAFLHNNILAIEAMNPKYGITTTGVNFRGGASTNSPIIRKLEKGTKLKILGEGNGFYITQLSNNEVGFVYKNYVSSSSSAPSGSLTYTNLGLKSGTINTDSVNFRRGPGTSFSSISKLSNGTKLSVIGLINGWYICITSNNTVGCVYKPYINLNTTSNNATTNTGTNSNVQVVLDIINDARRKINVAPLKLGATLPKIAELKAQDMVNNNYFSHNSPTYGSPFNMMENYNIDYNAAGENIAGNPNIRAAVESWLASDTHKQNLLSSSYTYIGIGIAKSEVYGYIIVAMFVG